jgi:hypothetical protein
VVEVECDIRQSLVVVGDDMLGIFVTDDFLLPRLLNEINDRDLLVDSQLAIKVLRESLLCLDVI